MSPRSLVWFPCAVLLVMVVGIMPVKAQGWQSLAPSFVEPGAEPSFAIQVGLRKYFNSFTSWQLPDSRGPQDPVSRLEFPWDQTFFMTKIAMAYSSLELSLEGSGTLAKLSNPKAQDSDWTFPNNPGQKTIFSEADAKPHCWIFDVGITAPIGQASRIKGIGGYRISQFKFTNTDMNQKSLIPEYDTGFIPGPAIEFVQYYRHWYAGGVFDAELNMDRFSDGLRGVPLLLVRLQADVSYVRGTNRDEHVLLPKMAEMHTRGMGWHANLSVGIQRRWFTVCLETDARCINTTGNLHGIFRNTSGQVTDDISVDGAKAWSEQKYVGLNGTVLF